MSRWLQMFARAFPLWVTLGATVAFVRPEAFSWFIRGGFVAPGLAVIMLAMGLTLDPEDFRLVAKRPGAVLLGVFLQFSLMPLIGFSLGKLLSLSEPLAAGLVLVCCCPGGTASNVISFLAKADVALSVTLTAVSTLLAAFLTPTLTALLVGSRISVDVVSLYLTTLVVVVLPVTVGLVARRVVPNFVSHFSAALPSLAVIAIVLIVGGILAVQREAVLEAGPRLLGAVFLGHGLAFLLAFILAGVKTGFGTAARTVSIEVGMQNSGLGVVLARASFPDPLVAVTPAVSAVVHCLYGSVLATIWGRRVPPGYSEGTRTSGEESE